MSDPVQVDEDSAESFEQIVRSYEETLSLANITAASSIERLGSIRDEVDLLKGSLGSTEDGTRSLESLMRKLSRECEKMEKSRQDSLTRLYDVEKSRDQLKARLDTSSEALGKEEVSRWKLQSAHENALEDAEKMQKEVQRLGKMLQEETAMKDDLAGKLKALQDEKVTTDALVHRLREQLKSSMPAAEVQNLLQAAEKRVFEICEGTKRKLGNMQVALSKAQIENKKLREQVKCGSASAVNESRLKDEILLRKRAEKRANEATKRARDLEKRLEGVEGETNQLRSMLREAKEGLGVMKTIARIRDGSGNERSNQSIGFDAVAKKIDSITSNVNRKALKSNLRNASKQHGDKTMYSMKPSIPTKPSSMRSYYGRPEI